MFYIWLISEEGGCGGGGCCRGGVDDG